MSIMNGGSLEINYTLEPYLGTLYDEARIALLIRFLSGLLFLLVLLRLLLCRFLLLLLFLRLLVKLAIVAS